MEILSIIERAAEIMGACAFIGACALFYQHNKDK